MISIECPKCGREGNVPLDRIGSRLTCRGCQAVFHMDSGGRMVLGEPGAPNKKQPKPRTEASSKVADFNLAEAWNNIPKPARYGVPAFLAVFLAWMYLAPSGSKPDFVGLTETVVRAVISNDRSRVLSYSTPSTAEAAGKWFDLMHGEVEKSQITQKALVNPSVFSGNPDKDSQLVMMAVISNPSVATSKPVAFRIHLNKSGDAWMIDGTGCLTEAENLVSTSTPRKNR